MKKTGQRKKRIIILPVTIVLTLSMIAGIFYMNSRSVEARATLPGIEKIVMDNGNEDPYVILEVLPDKKDARLGYLVGGEEPADNTARALSDMPSEAERTVRLIETVPIIPDDLSSAVTFQKFYEEAEAAANAFTVRGTFEQAGENKGDYRKANADEVYEICNTPAAIREAIAAGKTLYRKYISYRTENGDGNYALTIKQYSETVTMPVPVSSWDDTNTDSYNYQYFVAEKVEDEVFSNAADGDLIYQGGSTGDTLVYLGMISHTATLNLNSTPQIKPEAPSGEETTSKEETTSQEPTTTTTEQEGTSKPQSGGEQDNVTPAATSQQSAANQETGSATSNFVRDAAIDNATDNATDNAKGAATDNATDNAADTTSSLTTQQDTQLLTDLAPTLYEACYIVHEAQGTDAGSELYYITGADSTWGPYQAQTAFQAVTMDENDTYDNIDPDTDGVFYVRKDNASDYTYVDDGSGDYLFHADYTKDIVDSFSYNNGFKNAEWFKKNVFDLDEEQCASMVIDVVPVTMEELNTYDLSTADMIFFAGGEAAYTTDISVSAATAIAGRVINEYFPVVLNRSVYTKATGTPNIHKLAACLMQGTLPAAGTFEDNLTEAGWNALTLNSLNNTMKQAADGTLSYVNQTVYVNDDIETADNGVETIVPFVSSDFITDFSNITDKVTFGFQDVADEIESENFYRKVAGETLMATTISKATAIRYIINYGNKRVVTKSQLTILDLEPYDASNYTDEELRNHVGKNNTNYSGMTLTRDTLTKDWFVDTIATQFKDKEDSVAIETMGTKEFVGKLDDLNATYDMIYIGMDTAIMNTEITGSRRHYVKTANTLYNDSAMKGLIYAHVGDLVNTADGVGYMPQRGYRYSGNDITYEKLQELISYVKAGYTILLSDDFFKEDGVSINTAKLDTSSNLYTFIHDTAMAKQDGEYLYFGKNVNTRGTLEKTTAAKETFVKYLNISKLNIECTQKPQSYNPEEGTTQTGQQYLTVDTAGNYSLDYEFTLSNDAAVEIANTTYDCSLYIDLDADGRFETTEKQSGLTITMKNGDSWTDTSLVDGNYHLNIGYQYHVKRNVPDGYTGLVSWKLIFTENTAGSMVQEKTEIPSIRKEISGFCAVPAPATVPTIRVLQIYSNDNIGNLTGATLDLASNEMEALYSQVKDFKIQVEQISAADYIAKKSFTDSHYNYLCGYNMIVMGFDDSYSFSTKSSNEALQAILAIRQYTLSGRSILFTHDLTSPCLESYNNWGYYANRYLRDVMGMDRFNDISTYNTIPSDAGYQYTSKFDTSILQENTQETNSFNNPTIAGRLAGATQYGETSRYVTRTYNVHKDINQTRFNTSKISMINEGQITQYPFRIAQTMEVAHTHPQYFQLNLDTNSRDDNGNDDIVVWYTISGVGTDPYDDYFKANQNDVRNNYYIYNKGNVTYTGSGDSKITSKMEQQLFVNTLVASYNAGIHAPSAVYKENNWDSSATITNKYLPYDSAVNDGAGSYLESDGVVVNFKAINNDLTDSTKPIYAKYYVDVTDTAETPTVTIGSKKLKEITPVTFVRNVVSGNQINPETVSPETLTNYNIYTAKFNAADLGLLNSSGTLTKQNTATIYIRLSSDPLTEVDKANEEATESLNRLVLVQTELMDLE